MEDRVTALTQRKAELERLLKAREGKSGFTQNCQAIKSELAAIEQEMAADV